MLENIFGPSREKKAPAMNVLADPGFIKGAPREVTVEFVIDAPAGEIHPIEEVKHVETPLVKSTGTQEHRKLFGIFSAESER